MNCSSGSINKTATRSVRADVIIINVLFVLVVIQGALTQLIQYYHRFQKVLSHNPFKNLAIRSELINIHNVMVEVKKHKPNF